MSNRPERVGDTAFTAWHDSPVACTYCESTKEITLVGADSCIANGSVKLDFYCNGCKHTFWISFVQYDTGEVIAEIFVANPGD